jgi:hypothetical protein
MSAFNENKPVIKQGAQGEYYEVDGIKYTGTFPYKWATDHKFLDGTDFCSGPKDCGNCRVRGSINGVFVFYCANCVNIYDDIIHPKRNGYIYDTETVTDEELWEACPYMRGIPRTQIGDNMPENVERARYWTRRERYWDAYYDENGRSIFDEGFREPLEEPQDSLGDKLAEEEPTSDVDEDRFFCYYAANNVIQREIEGQKLREFNERQLQMASEKEPPEEAVYAEDYEYEAYRDNSDYYDQWDEPYSHEYPITRSELAQIPADMRAAFDPAYQEGFANFRAAAIEY